MDVISIACVSRIRVEFVKQLILDFMLENIIVSAKQHDNIYIFFTFLHVKMDQYNDIKNKFI